MLSVLLPSSLVAAKQSDTNLSVDYCQQTFTVEEGYFPVTLVEAFRELIEAAFF